MEALEFLSLLIGLPGILGVLAARYGADTRPGFVTVPEPDLPR